jgi:hypothetical protein
MIKRRQKDRIIRSGRKPRGMGSQGVWFHNNSIGKTDLNERCLKKFFDD